MPFVARRVFDWEPVEITGEWGLRDLKPGMAYPLCNSLQCGDCGMLFLDIRFDDAEMSALYTGYRDEAYTSLRDRFEPGYRARNELLNTRAEYISQVERFLAPHVGPEPRILDWGGDTGFNTPFRAQSRLHHIHDISDKAPVAGAVRVDAQAIAANEYDLIVSSAVLEHIPFPLDMLSAIAAAMTPRTLLYLEVPHEDLVRLAPESRELFRRKKHWHEHINFFNEHALRTLLVRCGLRMVEMQSLAIAVAGKDCHVFSCACRLDESTS